MTESDPTIKIVLAKPGLDGHDRGSKVLALGLSEAGMHVTYLGIRSTAEAIVQTAVDAEADVVALSCLSGAHEYHFGRVADLLTEQGMGDVLLIGGGIIPDDDIPALKAAGVREVFTPGSSTEEIVGWVRANIKSRREA